MSLGTPENSAVSLGIPENSPVSLGTPENSALQTLSIIIMTEILSTAPYLTDKGKHTAFYKINKIYTLKSQK